MIDCRMLIIGNDVDFLGDNKNKFLTFRSNCYFDWMNLIKVPVKNESMEEVFQEWYKTYLQKRKESLNCYHIQQSFMLISDLDSVDDDICFDEAPLLYVSLINSSNTVNGTKPFEAIKTILRQNGAQGATLYHCLDHCNYVLVCDGGKIKLGDYLQLLIKIKNLTDTDNNIIVHDVTTLYGYNFERLQKFSSNEHIRLVLSVNKSDSGSINLAKNLEELKEKWGSIFDCVGRYDHMLVSSPITWNDFSSIAEVLYQNRKKIFASRIHICLESQDETLSALTDENNETDLDNKNVLIGKIKTNFDNSSKSIYSKIYKLDPQTATQINYALHEVYYSICTMLRRAFSNYFVLCFYESFCQLMECIDKKILFKDDMKGDDIDYYCEKIYDLINSYFTYLRTLVASTLHSERRFVQADPHQLTYFDIPPKLIAFYTAFASKMSNALRKALKSKNRYTFLIVPDFKKDIYVESLTKNRDIQEELNILIIHINEKSMYDVSQTTKILAHEIAHHAGLDCTARKKRAKAYMRCILASKICMNMNTAIYKTTPKDKWQDLFESILEVFITCIDTYAEKKFDIEHLLEIEHDPMYVYSSCVPLYYYSDRFIREYDDYLLGIFQDNDLLNEVADQLLIKKLPSEPFDEFFKFYESDKLWPKLSSAYNKETSTFLKKYAINKFISDLSYDIICDYIRDDKHHVNIIEYIFKEGIADIQMLCLISPSHAKAEDIGAIYSKMFSVLRGRYEIDENVNLLRQLAVLSSIYDEIAHSNSEKFDDDGAINEEIYTCYLKKQLIDVFRSIKPNGNSFYNDEEASNAFTCDRVISLFLKSNPKADEVVGIIDNVVNEYQHELH